MGSRTFPTNSRPPACWSQIPGAFRSKKLKLPSITTSSLACFSWCTLSPVCRSGVRKTRARRRSRAWSWFTIDFSRPLITVNKLSSPPHCNLGYCRYPWLCPTPRPPARVRGFLRPRKQTPLCWLFWSTTGASCCAGFPPSLFPARAGLPRCFRLGYRRFIRHHFHWLRPRFALTGSGLCYFCECCFCARDPRGFGG